MAKQTINVGTTANDKKGDSLRAAFQKVNANFTELYTQLGLTDPTLNLGAFTFTGSVMSTDDSTNIVIDRPITVNGEITVDGDIVPKTDLGASLGTPTRQFKSLYVSDSTVYFGGVPLSVEAGTNELTINNVPVSQTINYADIPNAPKDLSDLTDNSGSLGGGGNSFDQDLNTDDSVTFNSVGATTVNVSQINGTNPGDELVIQANNHNWTFDTNGNLTFPQGTLLGYSDPGGFIIDGAVDKDIAIYTYSGADAHGWTFGTDGSLTIPGDIRSEGNINIDINLSDSTLRRWQFGEDGDLTLPNGGKFNNPYGDGAVNLSGNQDLYSALASYDTKSWAGVVDATYSVSDFGAAGGGFFIQTDVGVTNKTWAFRADGDLTLPAGGDILNSSGQSVLGGGSNSYTPDDSDNWDSPTVNTVAAALDELAAKVAALENFEIDGGNAYTPAAGELIIDGNGA